MLILVFFVPFNNKVLSYDTSVTQELGYNESNDPNFIAIDHGQGKFILHIGPAAFSNYFLLTGNNKEYLEKTMAAGMYYYITHPQAITDKPAQLHELSEGRSFLLALKYRASTSKLTAADYQTLVSIVGPFENAYALINDATFAKLKQAQQILTNTYGQLQP